MEASELRAVQAPLKQRYGDDPDSAVVTLSAEGSLSDSEVSCSVEAAARARGPFAAGLDVHSDRPAGLVACSEHIHVAQAHEKLADARRVNFHRGTRLWLA